MALPIHRRPMRPAGATEITQERSEQMTPTTSGRMTPTTSGRMTPTTSGGGPRPRRGGLLAAALLSGVALGALGVPALTPRADAAPPPVPASCAAFVARYFESPWEMWRLCRLEHHPSM